MRLITVAVERPVLMTMLTSFLLVIGVLALRALPVDLYPSVSYPMLVVICQLPGAAPEEMEQLVTRRVEDALSTLAGLNTLRSSSREGQAFISMEFAINADIRFQEMQVRAKIANLRKSLPEEMGEPTIYRQDPDDTPIIELALSGQRSAAELTVLAEDLARQIQQLPGVGAVDLSGDRRPEILVELDRAALSRWRLNATAIPAALNKANRNDPSGKIDGKERSWVVRTLAAAKSVAELGALNVGRQPSGTPILLRDVATIQQGFAELRRVSYVGDAGGLGPAVLLSILKQSGENTLSISTLVRERIKLLEQDLPPDVRLRITRDNADLVRSNVADVYESMAIGTILTVLVVLLFLGSWRATLTTGLALPSSIITTFACLYVAGFTVNVMSLLALSLAVGLLVDDAVVVRENIFRHLLHSPPVEAAIRGANEVSLAVLATTLVIVAVFLPVGFMGGSSGQFFRQFALTVVFAVLVSLWDALTMAPMLSAYFANIADPAKEWAPFGAPGRLLYAGLHRFEQRFDRLTALYARLLAWLLPRPLYALVAALLAVGAAVGGFSLLPKAFLPSQLGNVFSASLNGPIAVPPAQVRELGAEVQRRVAAVPGLSYWTLSAGTGWGGGASLDLTIQIKESFASTQTALAAVRTSVREALAGIPGYDPRISEPADPLAAGGGRFQPISIALTGDDWDQLLAIGRALRLKMQDIPGVSEISPISDEGLPELRLKVDQGLSAHYGLSPADIGDNLRLWLTGDSSNSLRVGAEQVPIRVRLKGATTMGPSELAASNIFVRTASSARDFAVPLGAVARWEAGAGPRIISRENRQRILRIGGGLKHGAALGDVISKVEAVLAAEPLPQGYRARIVGQNEQMNELFANVLIALGLGLIFIYMVLASLFESFIHPLTVMMAIPLAATGAVLALLATQTSMDLYAGVGMILLAGIVAKNSILLIDSTLQRTRSSAIDARDALLAAAPQRLRPIIMTSVAMLAGMLPVALGLGSGGEARRSLGIATIGGVLSSTLLTLIVVPNLFLLLERLRRLSGGRGRASPGGSAEYGG